MCLGQNRKIDKRLSTKKEQQQNLLSMGTGMNKLVFLESVFHIHSSAEKVNLRQCDRDISFTYLLLEQGVVLTSTDDRSEKKM